MAGPVLTISVNKDRIEYRPGDTDPIIAGSLCKYATSLLHMWNPMSSGWSAARDLADFFHSRAVAMTRGGNLDWWDGLAGSAVERESNGKSETAHLLVLMPLAL